MRARLTGAGRLSLRRRHLDILEAVRECGSLNAGAQRLGVSYRNAWASVRQLEAQLGIALIDTQTGGRRGGGSRLTAAGEDFVRRLHDFLTEQQAAATHAARRHFGAPARPARCDVLRVATTTSVVDSGLLGALLPPFTSRTGMAVEVQAVGSGAALRLASAGRTDVVLAHAPAHEERAVAAGHIVDRHVVMTNHFVLLGPPQDPAGVRVAATPETALRRIAAARAPYLSRADGSGTHAREQALLRAASVRPGAWLRAGHCGMAELLRRASATQSYLLSDAGTWAALADSLELEVLADGAERLTNRYTIAATNPHRHGDVRFVEAMALIGWLRSPTAQALIGEFRVAQRRIAEPAAEW